MDANLKSKVDVTGIEPVTCCISDNRSKPTELYVIKLGLVFVTSIGKLLGET